MTVKKSKLDRGNGSRSTLRQRVRARLAEIDMTQDDLATKIGIGPSMISMVLRERVTRPDLVKAIEKALGMATPAATLEEEQTPASSAA